jgi:hypothetical protein
MLRSTALTKSGRELSLYHLSSSSKYLESHAPKINLRGLIPWISFADHAQLFQYAGKFEKALARLLSRPKDFTSHELKTILNKFGYTMQQGAGSRRKFIHAETRHIISLHEPHPRPILKSYAVEYIIEELKRQGLI